MKYDCKLCEAVVLIEHTSEEVCNKCGLTYTEKAPHEENKTKHGASSDAAPVEAARR